MKNRVTIYDVAKAADVSLATVSRVLNNNSVVKESTRKAVEEAMKNLGYRPNEIARGLAISKTTNICIITNGNHIEYNEKFLNGMMNVAKIYNYNIYFQTVSKGITNMEDIVENITKRMIDGVILFKSQFSDSELEKLEDSGIPVVVIGTYFDITGHEKVGNVYVDFEQMGYDIAKRYIDKGIDDFGLVFDYLNKKVSEYLAKGVKKALSEIGKEFDNVITYNLEGATNSFKALSSVLKTRKPSQVMISVRDTHAFAVIQSFTEMGYKCPDDFELINVSDNKYLNMYHQKISSYGIPDYDMGAIGCRLLTKMMEEKEIQSQQIKVSYFLNERQTTKK